MLTKQKLPTNILKRVLSNFDLGKIQKFEPMATSGNISYLIKTNQESYFLRLCPLGGRWRSKTEIVAEIELLKHLQKNNFPIVMPIKDKKGQEIISWKKHHGYLRKFIKHQCKLKPSLIEIKKFGKTIGWFHSLIEGFKTNYKRNHIFDLTATQKSFNQEKEKQGILTSNFRNKKEFVKRFNQEIFALNFPRSLPQGTIHEDLGKRHVLWQKDKIAGIVDFDRSYFGKLVLDLGEACRSWCFDNWQKWNNQKFKALIKGYQSKRKLTKLEKKYLVDAIKFGILERSLSFCWRFIEVTQDKEDEEFTNQSLFKLVDLVEKNRKRIEEIIK